tara:strand:- start:2473 stop:2628 length:156 start_codon:yes stop_codon:yes gene_type:complete
MVVFVFDAPSIADFLQDSRGWFAGAAAQVDALPIGLLACFFIGRLAPDFGN